MFKPVTLIPVYNHEQSVGAVVQMILSYGVDCILVNDGSKPECQAVLSRLASQYPQRVYLFEHAFNQGKGAAISTGLKEALKLGFSHALQVDADGQHNIDDIPIFLEAAEKNPEAVICGYPIYDQNVPKHRFYLRYLTHVWVWINTFSLRIKDSMCGFRVYPLCSSVRIISQNRLFSRMSFDIEFLVRADWAGVVIINSPTKVYYPENGISHFLAVKDNIQISLMHTRLFFGMLWRFPFLFLRHFRDKPRYLSRTL